MWSRQTCVCFCVLSFLNPANAAVIQEMCVGSLNGVWSGGRCFYIPKISPVDFDTAWAACEESNESAALAQIHTSAEYVLIEDMIDKTNHGSGVWIALGPTSKPSGSCSFQTNDTYWYDTPNQPNSGLKSANTWIRSHSCEDITNYGEEVGILVPNNFFDSSLSSYPFSFFDSVRSYLLRPLCQVASCTATYEHNAGKCIAESPSETFSSTNVPQACADACSSRIWCRSFEHQPCGNECRLYSWSLVDTGCKEMECADLMNLQDPGNCIHYDSEL